jgi:hypothetical protein
VLTEEDYAAVAELAREYGFYVLGDEIYNRFVYEDEHISMMSVPDFLDQLILLDGHSKTYAMTGWRLGFAVTSAELARRLTLLMTNSVSCTAAFTQVAGEEALLGDQSEAEAMIQEFKVRRDLIVDGLNSIPGIKCHRPKGAFYVFPNIKAYTEPHGRTSADIQRTLLHDYGLACLAGTSFGPNGVFWPARSAATRRQPMIRLSAIAFALFGLLAFASSCLDEEPAEVSIRLTKGGKPIDALIMLHNDKGVQVQEHHTERSFVIIKQLKPGKYYLKFKDYGDPPTIYPATREFELVGGDSKVIDVDLDDTTQNAADFPGGA